MRKYFTKLMLFYLSRLGNKTILKNAISHKVKDITQDSR